MRALEKPSVVFSAEQWEDIRRAGRHAGIDVDTLRGQLTFMAKMTPALVEFMADLPTPFDVATYLKQQRTKAMDFLASVASVVRESPLHTYVTSGDNVDHYPGWEREDLTTPRQALRSTIDVLLWALSSYIEALEIDHARFTKLGSRSSKNPSKRTAKRSWYLTGVLSAWRNIGGDRAKRKVTLEFLFACAVPVFKDTTEIMVRNWFDRHEPNPRSPD